MIALQTVHCPVDSSAAMLRQIDVAADLCRAFGARLVLHHNRHVLGTGANVGWMWNADHHGDSQSTVEARLGEWMSRVPEGVPVEKLITEGPVSHAVLAVSDAVDADLVVLTAHGTMADDHASITERVLASGRRAVLVLHEPGVDERAPRFTAESPTRQIVVAPTDFTPESRAAVELGFDLARTLPIELHLLHLVPRNVRRSHDNAADIARRQLSELLPVELRDRARLHVADGDPGRGIVRAARQLDAACIVMGEHTRTPLRRWLSRDTSRQVMHDAPCPVWYVPGAPRAISS